MTLNVPILKNKKQKTSQEASWIVVLGKTLESPLDSKDIKPVNLKGNQPWILIGRTDAEAPIFLPPDTNSRLIGKDPDSGKNWRQKERRATEDEMVGWNHWLNGHELGQTPGDDEGQGSLVCCSPWECKEPDMTWRLNNKKNCTELLAAAAKSLQSCPTLQPHRWQPTRLPHPWDSPGKNTGVGCHFLLQCMKVKSESEVAQLCPTPSGPRDCSPPGPSVHGIFQARVLEWGAIAFSSTELLSVPPKHYASAKADFQFPCPCGFTFLNQFQNVQL